ncbi:related to Heterokaryon incompatibility protein s [Phialocephala subalpina]|uniref:Related to Heterokaryon incompatibility protein s n=1 Tax=Phialocephala subalpina TaxID=576137 RepID=A0A1L7WZV0_9HELO|nr:related to Heterokaryon incompatibility protein s [Phialocephala subalpina]
MAELFSTHNNMAEIFGVAASALSIAALFNNVVDCFEYIQLGRNFGTDYQTCQLRLDIARLRLSRWGAAVDINDNVRFAEIKPIDDEACTAKSTLEQILNLFSRAYTESSAFKLRARADDLVLSDPSTNADQTIVALRNSMHELARKRQKRTSLSKKISWALYKHKYLTRLIVDINELLDSLESIFAQPEAYKRMVEVEIEEISDEPRLQILSEAAEDDMLLCQAVNKRLQMLGGNTIDKANVSETAKVRVGNENVAQGTRANARATANRIGELNAKGSSKVHVGDNFLETQFWNN